MGSFCSKKEKFTDGILTKHQYKGKASICQNIFALLMKRIVKDSLTSISMDTLKVQRDKFARELPGMRSTVEKMAKKNMAKCDI